MKLSRTYTLIAAFALLASVAVYWKTTHSSSPANHRRVLFYQDSMHPWIKSDRPGKCTICAMDLTPILEGEQGMAANPNLIVLSTNSLTVLDVQSEAIAQGPLKRSLRIAGLLEPDDSRKRVISTLNAGRIESLTVPYVGAEVTEGQCLARFFSPEILAEKRRYVALTARTSRVGQGVGIDSKDASPLSITIQNLRLYGLSDKQIEELAHKQEVDSYTELFAPISGTVVEKNFYEGQYVEAGAKLFTIVDSSVLWFRFDIYEQQLPWIRIGQKMEVVVPSLPGRHFSATISFIEPILNDATRTIKVRANIENPLVEHEGRKSRLLQYQLYAEGRVETEIPEVLAVPRSAILFPGATAYLYVDRGNGAYERRLVRLGRKGDQAWEVLEGVSEGEKVVISGNVLIDAQAQFTQGSELPDLSSALGPSSLSAEPGEMAMPIDPPAGGPMQYLTESQSNILERFLTFSDGLSAALAGDQLEAANQHGAKITEAATSLVKAFEAPHPWHELIQRIQQSAQWTHANDLKLARSHFLPISTNTVALVQQVRGLKGKYGAFKVFYCPMAPPPGLWMQAKGPLRNPYYGAKMLTCGEEVPPLPRSELIALKAALPVTAVAHPNHSQVLTSTNTGSQSNPPVPSTENLTKAFDAASSGSRYHQQSGRSTLTPNQRKAVEGVLTVADQISQALASDDDKQIQVLVTKLPVAMNMLRQQLGRSHTWKGLIEKIPVDPKWGTAASLEEARACFLAFSTHFVEWIKVLRQQEVAFAKVKIYQCPMAPKPGLWFQQAEPLRNPYFGSKMLDCGSEVTE